jgi:hypothetical protein
VRSFAVAAVLAVSLAIASGANAATSTGADPHDVALANQLVKEMDAILRAQMLREAQLRRFLVPRMSACRSLLKRALSSQVTSGDLGQLGDVDLMRANAARYSQFDQDVANGNPDAEVFRTWATNRLGEEKPFWAMLTALPRKLPYCKLARIAPLHQRNPFPAFRAVGLSEALIDFVNGNIYPVAWRRDFQLFLLESGLYYDDASNLADF